MRFYDIDENYVKYLRTIDNQVPNIHYSSNNKFVCGVVLEINNVKYYAPVSHTTKKYQTSMLIYDGKRPISSIRFSFMLPATDKVLVPKDFKQIAKANQNYANLLLAEFEYCLKHTKDIKKKARSVYNIGCNKSHRLNYTCCDFQKLESEYMKYFK